MSVIHQSSVLHTGGMSFEVSQNGHRFLMDVDPESGGENKGVRPKALILTSLAGCTGMDVVSLLHKMRVEFSDFSIAVEGDLTDEHPKIYDKIRLVYHIRIVQPTDKEKVEKAVMLSQERYCGVSAMIRKFADLDFSISYLE